MFSTVTSTSTRLLRVFQRNTYGSIRVIARPLSNAQDGSTRQLTPQTAAHVAALPPTPSRPTSRPTPWLKPLEMLQYLVPLDTSIPWKLHTANTLLRRKGIPFKDSPVGNGLFFIGSYYFSDVAGASEFAEEVKKISREEMHEPSFMRINEQATHLKDGKSTDAETGDKKPAQVYIRINTHEAYIPNEILDLRLGTPAKDVTPFPENLEVPGITLRDVRFVMLVDKLFRDRFLHPASESDSDSQPTDDNKTGLVSLVYPPEVYANIRSRAQLKMTEKLASSIQKSDTEESIPEESIRRLADLISSIFRHRFCPCCGLPHKLAECPVRFEYPPTNEQTCKHCEKEGHWSSDCEQAGKPKKRNDTVVESSSLEGNPEV
ncbi:hypothetical protein F5050DRAFT_1726125 [Lentinula boryana]|uniref:CCHC-type domain-containing protein n=1 Tax=Lentinula boryana TaxID=40481 RepID=A0ABQ8QRS4_9AGAR|nr:hypothetical protein F5050DRAFT_1726125 [Lentinula boryana]